MIEDHGERGDAERHEERSAVAGVEERHQRTHDHDRHGDADGRGERAGVLLVRQCERPRSHQADLSVAGERLVGRRDRVTCMSGRGGAV